MYVCITKGLAEWVISKPKMIDSLYEAIRKIAENPEILKDSIFTEGQFRMALSKDNSLLAVWNIDYLTGTGEESYGFLKFSGDMSVSVYPIFAREAFERCIYLVNQRLQGLLVEGAFYHRKHSDNIHTLLAGRGTDARQYSLGYYDVILDRLQDSRSIIINGPSDSFVGVVESVRIEYKKLEILVSLANSIIFNNSILSVNLISEFSELRNEIRVYTGENLSSDSAFSDAQFNMADEVITQESKHKSIGQSFESWMSADSTLTGLQRGIIESDAIDRHPVRIIGPAGSGKTLIMQLMAARRMQSLKDSNNRIIYIIHNEAMRNKVIQNFQVLFPDTDIGIYRDNFIITTLSEYCREELQLGINAILDQDASEARSFQLGQILEIINDKIAKDIKNPGDSKIFGNIFIEPDKRLTLAGLIASEISVAIKGNGLQDDKNRYVNSERSLSHLHGKISTQEREFIFEIFEEYHNYVFNGIGVMDPDDLAISLYGRFKTPLWTLQRRDKGFDYIFVDEAQLFSENEKRVFPLLSKKANGHVPIVLALDEAQSLYGGNSAGYSALGIKDISNHNLNSIHRSSKDIIELAFFVLQRSTNLFSIDFPDFTQNDFMIAESDKDKIKKPRIEFQSGDSNSFSKFILRRIRELRKSDIRKIAIVCINDHYWDSLAEDLQKSDLPFLILKERGEKINSDQPHVVLCKPAQVGGQEFEAVIIVGVGENQSISENVALFSAIEQQFIRELYLSITRARYQVIFALEKFAKENIIIRQAIENNLIVSP